MLTLKILTPDRTVLEAEAYSVSVRTTEGELGILPGHEPLVSALAAEGMLRIRFVDGGPQVFIVLGGYISVKNNVVTVLSPVADHPERIPEVLAEMERQRTAKQVSEQKAALEIQRAETALRRTLVKREVSTEAMLHEKEESGDESEE